MKKTKRRKGQKTAAKLMKKAKKVSNSAKKKAGKRTKKLLGQAKNKLRSMKKKSLKSMHRAKNKIYATEEEIMHYVKKNPIKSISAVALTGLIAGFLAYRYKTK